MDGDRLPLGGEVVVGLRHVHGAHVAHGVLGGAQHRRALLHQLLGKLGDRVLELLRRHRVIDQPDARRFRAVERLAQAGVVECVARQHRVGHRLGDERAGQDSPVHFGEREGRVLRRDREVAGDQLHEGAADAEAVHHRDGRLVVAVEPLPAPAVGRRRRLLALGRVLLQLAEEFLQVLPGAEVAAFAAHHDDAHVLVDLEPRQRVVHVVVQLRAHGVALVGAVEKYPGDAVVDAHLDELVFVLGHRSSPCAFDSVLIHTCAARGARGPSSGSRSALP